MVKYKVTTIVNYRDRLWWAVQKRLNRWRCCLGCGFGWSRSPPREGAILAEKGPIVKYRDCEPWAVPAEPRCDVVSDAESGWPKEPRLRWGPDMGMGNIEGEEHRHARWHSDVSCAQMAELEWLWMDSGGPNKAAILGKVMPDDTLRELCKNGWTSRDNVWVMDSGGPREACGRWRSRSSVQRSNF